MALLPLRRSRGAAREHVRHPGRGALRHRRLAVARARDSGLASSSASGPRSASSRRTSARRPATGRWPSAAWRSGWPRASGSDPDRRADPRHEGQRASAGWRPSAGSRPGRPTVVVPGSTARRAPRPQRTRRGRARRGRLSAGPPPSTATRWATSPWRNTAICSVNDPDPTETPKRATCSSVRANVASTRGVHGLVGEGQAGEVGDVAAATEDLARLLDEAGAVAVAEAEDQVDHRRPRGRPGEADDGAAGRLQAGGGVLAGAERRDGVADVRGPRRSRRAGRPR